MSGEGEKQLELERRQIKNLEKILRNRVEKYKKTQKDQIERTIKYKKHLVVALIGYTNAGKSAVLNHFAKREAMESKDQLFQTLRTVSRSVKLKGNSRIIMVDTIGFVMDLPHEVVPAFMTTLEHIKTADLILHIRDISHPQTEEMNQTVLEVLKTLGMGDILHNQNKFIEVCNKVDLLPHHAQQPSNPGQIMVSATESINMSRLKNLIKHRANLVLKNFLFLFIHSQDEHSARLKWLFENANFEDAGSVEFSSEYSLLFPRGFSYFEGYINDLTLLAYNDNFKKEEPTWIEYGFKIFEDEFDNRNLKEDVGFGKLDENEIFQDHKTDFEAQKNDEILMIVENEEVRLQFVDDSLENKSEVLDEKAGQNFEDRKRGLRGSRKKIESDRETENARETEKERLIREKLLAEFGKKCVELGRRVRNRKEKRKLRGSDSRMRMRMKMRMEWKGKVKGQPENENENEYQKDLRKKFNIPKNWEK